MTDWIQQGGRNNVIQYYPPSHIYYIPTPVKDITDLTDLSNTNAIEASLLAPGS